VRPLGVPFSAHYQSGQLLDAATAEEAAAAVATLVDNRVRG
jgi:hypothetical protein